MNINITKLAPMFKKLEAAKQKKHDLTMFGNAVGAGAAVCEWKGSKVNISAGDIQVLKDVWDREIDIIEEEINEAVEEEI